MPVADDTDGLVARLVQPMKDKTVSRLVLRLVDPVVDDANSRVISNEDSAVFASDWRESGVQDENTGCPVSVFDIVMQRRRKF